MLRATILATLTLGLIGTTLVHGFDVHRAQVDFITVDGSPAKHMPVSQIFLGRDAAAARAIRMESAEPGQRRD